MNLLDEDRAAPDTIQHPIDDWENHLRKIDDAAVWLVASVVSLTLIAAWSILQ